MQLDLVTSEQFSVRLNSATVGAGFGSPVEAVVTVLPQVISAFNIAKDNLTIVTTSPQEVSILIQRTLGLQTAATVTYNTTQASQPVNIGSLMFQPAQQQTHFSQINTMLSFSRGQASSSISIPVLSVGTAPVAFLVQIGSSRPK